MLLIRGLIFTVVLPGTLAGFLPWLLRAGKVPQPGWWQSGWILLILGVALYLCCLASFLAANGTPAMFILGRFSAIVGQEPQSLVRGGLYRSSRNPMYVGVLAAVFGQAILFRLSDLALYGLVLFTGFHIAVVAAEEPHLRAKQGAAYDQYCRRVPRWLGWPRRSA
jgi:protein-S-isoprenylcysteine O-methyltransferase Ste14